MKKFLISVLSALLVLSLTVPAFAAEPALIGIPDDGTNLSRGIKLLEAAGLRAFVHRSSNPPQGDGCGYSLLVTEKVGQAERVLQNGGVRVLRISDAL